MDRDARAPARPPFGTPQTRPKAASGARHGTASAAAGKHKVNCHRNPFAEARVNEKVAPDSDRSPDSNGTFLRPNALVASFEFPNTERRADATRRDSCGTNARFVALHRLTTNRPCALCDRNTSTAMSYGTTRSRV
jgi:hypothetical protein